MHTIHVDPAKTDGWIRDERVDKLDRTAQIGNEFYGKQKTFEAERGSRHRKRQYKSKVS